MEFVNTVTISSKGQIVIPAAIRRRMKLKQNDTLIVAEEGQRLVLKPVARLSELMGVDKGKLNGWKEALEKDRIAEEEELDKQVHRIKAAKKS